VVAKPYKLETRDRWLVATFAQPCAVMSWAIVNGGLQHTAQVAWLYLRTNEIAGVDDVHDWMRAEMHAAGLAGAVGLMTTRRAHAWVEAFSEDSSARAWAVGTVGMSNALRAGDASGSYHCPGTINMLVCCSAALTAEAATEVLCLMSEAKAAAVFEAGVASVRSGLPATGTGTDYLALAWPATGERLRYGGKHTAAGAAVGRAAYDAVANGVREWQRELARTA